MACRFHVQTAGSSLTAQSVDNNVVRTTVQALAAVLGGAQSLHTNSRDEALALPTEDSVRLALRTQQILAYECGRRRDAGPARRLVLRRDAHRPSSRRPPRATSTRSTRWAARSPRSMPASSSARSRSRPTASSARSTRGDQVVVGVNRFRDDGGAPRRRSSGSTRKAERRQVAGVRRVRAERDPAAWEAAMRRLEDAARGTDNLLPPIIEAVKAYATVGEIADRLRAAWGVHRELITV